MKIRRQDEKQKQKTMVDINTEPSAALSKLHNSPIPLRRKIILFSVLLMAFLVAYSTTTSNSDTNSDTSASVPKSTFRTDKEGKLSKSSEIDGITTNNGLFIERGKTIAGKDEKEIPYYHCGPKYTQNNYFQSEEQKHNIEILLLHGAAFTKENWLESGILEGLCERDSTKVSVTAADLHVKSDGKDLYDLFSSLTNDKVISGRPLSIVTPSASGKSVASLAEYVVTNTSPESEYLSNIMHIWIPVASGSVLKTSEEALGVFQKYSIPVLAMNGNQDEKGKLVTKRLGQFANAEEVEMEGGHPCYLDSPDDFILLLFDFIEKMPVNV